MHFFSISIPKKLKIICKCWGLKHLHHCHNCTCIKHDAFYSCTSHSAHILLWNKPLWKTVFRLPNMLFLQIFPVYGTDCTLVWTPTFLLNATLLFVHRAPSLVLKLSYPGGFCIYSFSVWVSTFLLTCDQPEFLFVLLISLFFVYFFSLFFLW